MTRKLDGLRVAAPLSSSSTLRPWIANRILKGNAIRLLHL